MRAIKTETLKDGMYFTKKLFLDKTFLLLDASIPVSKSLLQELEEWKFEQVFSDGEMSLGPMKALDMQSKIIKRQTLPDTSLIESAIEKKDELKRKNDMEKLETVRQVYYQYIAYTEYVYTHFSTHIHFDKNDIISKVKNLCIFMKDFSKYFLRITNETYPFSRTYLVHHSMRCLVISLAIGLQLHLPLSKLIDLGITAILHEVGMLKIPPQLYLTDRLLSAKEKKQLMTHPLLGVQILKQADFPEAIQRGVLEHHERENGSGYPRFLTGENISPIGKIISIACVYDGIISERRYKESKTTSQAIIELLRNESKQFDPVITKALLSCLSLYPIGTYVFLSTGKVGIVTDINPASLKTPFVELVGEYDESGRPKTIETNETDLKINRVLTNKEIGEIIKYVGKGGGGYNGTSSNKKIEEILKTLG